MTPSRSRKAAGRRGVGLLEAGKYHFRTGDVLFGVGQVFKQRIVRPCDTFGFVSVRVDVTGRLASFATKEAVQIGAGLVFASCFDSVALGAALDKQLKRE